MRFTSVYRNCHSDGKNCYPTKTNRYLFIAHTANGAAGHQGCSRIAVLPNFLMWMVVLPIFMFRELRRKRVAVTVSCQIFFIKSFHRNNLPIIVSQLITLYSMSGLTHHSTVFREVRKQIYSV